MINNKKVLVVIPARLGGYRFPDKPIRKILDKTMIEWVWSNASNSKYADKVVIATPDKRISEISESFGAESIMTKDNHLRGTERVFEAFEKLIIIDSESTIDRFGFFKEKPWIMGDHSPSFFKGSWWGYLQNNPIKTDDAREIRKSFIAEKGHTLVSADYNQVEMRILADLADVKELKKAFKNNEDIHSLLSLIHI